MTKVAVYNVKGKKGDDIELNDAIFGITPKSEVIHQVYLALEANSREPWAHVKTRGEVRGGGKKPWKQKGTGRARHGSIRSPLWVGGGVTFGPRNDRNYKQKINRKTNKLAVKMCLSGKIVDNTFIVIDDLDATGKTKEIADLRKELPGAGRTTLMLIDGNEQKLNLATRNIEKLDLQRAQDVNVVDLLHHQYIIATQKAVAALEKRFA